MAPRKRHNQAAFAALLAAVDGLDVGPWAVTIKGKMSCRHGTAYFGDLLHNGQPVGDFRNDGNGGVTFVHLFAPNAYWDELRAHVAAQPDRARAEHADPSDPGHVYDVEGFVSTMAEAVLDFAGLKRSCKTAMILLSPDGKGIRKLNRKLPNAEAVAWVAAHPGYVYLNPLVEAL
jgi:hypothetical protein